EGEIIVDKVNKNFDNIKLSFDNIDDCIEEEVKIVEVTSELFKRVQEEAESIASIAQEHSASTEEMLATLSEQDNNIEKISDLVKHIKDSAEELDGIAKKRV
ncbi:MAG: chemotaxis protein, partial [Clostridiales bacterium]|nr:chemotaxis protein [Clostridiales bacterium]